MLRDQKRAALETLLQELLAEAETSVDSGIAKG